MAATRTKSESRIEIVAERRRKHDETFRAEMVALSMAPGASVQALARQHGVALICRWRRLASRQAAPPTPEVRLLPVQIADRPCGSKPAGLIGIELANGNRVRVDAAVNVAALRRVLSVVARIRG